MNPFGKRCTATARLPLAKPFAVLFLAGALAACQSAQPGPGSLTIKSDKRALTAMEEISLAAGKCWFKSGNADFKAYRMAPELNSYSGKPRLLIVPRNRPQDRPLAVIEAQGDPATIHAYGPLMSASTGNRMAADIKGWAKGSSTCN